MKNIKQFLKILITITYCSLLYGHVRDFNTNYFRYSSINIVYEYYLQYLYYFMIIFEFISTFIHYFKVKNLLFVIYKWMLGFYIIIIVSLLIHLNYSMVCVDCHYVAKVFYLNNLNTLKIIISLFVVQFFILETKK